MEVIVAVAIIVTTLIAAIALVNFSVSTIVGGESTIIAVSLAQEGLEIIRSIRDNNWLLYKRKSDGSPDDWRNGLGLGDPDPKEYRVQYDNLSLLLFSDTFLKIDSDGFYQYDVGNNTPFKRKITIEHIGNNQIKSIIEVTWREKRRSRSIRAEDRLYNWLGP
jgi:hypothetical protein